MFLMWRRMNNRMRIYFMLGVFLLFFGIILIVRHTADFEMMAGGVSALAGAVLVLDPIVCYFVFQEVLKNEMNKGKDDDEDDDNDEEDGVREALYQSIANSELDLSDEVEEKTDSSKKNEPQVVEKSSEEKDVSEAEDVETAKKEEIATLRREIKNLGQRIQRASHKAERLNNLLNIERKKARSLSKENDEEGSKKCNEQMNETRVKLRDTRDTVKKLEKERQKRKEKLAELTSKAD